MRPRLVRPAGWVTAALMLAATLGGAGASELAVPRTWEALGGPVGLVAVPEPVLIGTEQDVRELLTGARAELAELLRDGAITAARLGEAYGQLGRFYHAHHLYAAAAACYANAGRLAPEEFRWPYLQGYVFFQASDPERAVEAYLRALALRDDYPPAWLRLAVVYLDLNRSADARPLLERSRGDPRTRAAALFALGRAALDARDYAAARDFFEQTLAERAEATQVHYPLAMAYRGLGDLEQARAHLRQRGDGEPKVDDPLVDELGTLLAGPRTHYFRAIEAVRDGHYEDAVFGFRAALESDPQNANARVSLARALYLSGDAPAAKGELVRALEQEPGHALGNFLLGALLEEQGESAAAEAHYRRALETDPQQAGAEFYLANLLMRRGEYSAAAGHYRRARELTPENAQASLLEAMALLQSGAPRTLVSDHLSRAAEAHPDQTYFAFALARVLATMPEDAAVNGARALALAEELFQSFNSLENAETLAMAYAQVGRFEDAASLQRDAVAAAAGAGRFYSLPVLEARLQEYEAGRPLREPFSHGDQVLAAPAPRAFGPFRDYPTLHAY